MSKPEAAGEPSMEEILASIRKIIAEDPPYPRSQIIAEVATRPAQPATQSFDHLDDFDDGDLPSMLRAKPRAEKTAPLLGRIADAIRGTSVSPPQAAASESGYGQSEPLHPQSNAAHPFQASHFQSTASRGHPSADEDDIASLISSDLGDLLDDGPAPPAAAPSGAVPAFAAAVAASAVEKVSVVPPQVHGVSGLPSKPVAGEGASQQANAPSPGWDAAFASGFGAPQGARHNAGAASLSSSSSSSLGAANAPFAPHTAVQLSAPQPAASAAEPNAPRFGDLRPLEEFLSDGGAGSAKPIAGAASTHPRLPAAGAAAGPMSGQDTGAARAAGAPIAGSSTFMPAAGPASRQAMSSLSIPSPVMPEGGRPSTLRHDGHALPPLGDFVPSRGDAMPPAPRADAFAPPPLTPQTPEPTGFRLEPPSFGWTAPPVAKTDERATAERSSQPQPAQPPARAEPVVLAKMAAEPAARDAQPSPARSSGPVVLAAMEPSSGQASPPSKSNQPPFDANLNAAPATQPGTAPTAPAPGLDGQRRRASDLPPIDAAPTTAGATPAAPVHVQAAKPAPTVLAATQFPAPPPVSAAAAPTPPMSASMPAPSSKPASMLPPLSGDAPHAPSPLVGTRAPQVLASSGVDSPASAAPPAISASPGHAKPDFGGSDTAPSAAQVPPKADDVGPDGAKAGHAPYGTASSAAPPQPTAVETAAVPLGVPSDAALAAHIASSGLANSAAKPVEAPAVDAETKAAVASALGALAAGLAASSGKPGSDDAAPTAPAAEPGASAGDPPPVLAQATQDADAAASTPAVSSAMASAAPQPAAAVAAGKPVDAVANTSAAADRGHAHAVVNQPAAVADPKAAAPAELDALALLNTALAATRAVPEAEIGDNGSRQGDRSAAADAAHPTVGQLVPSASRSMEIATSDVGERTLDDTVAELLRPMLRQWLSDNMPRIVEKALRIEIAQSVNGPKSE